MPNKLTSANIAMTVAAGRAEIENVIRPRSHKTSKSNTYRRSIMRVEVNSGAAVNTKPTADATAKPASISCACQTIGPFVIGGSGVPNMKNPAHAAMANTAVAAVSRKKGRKPHSNNAASRPEWINFSMTVFAAVSA